MHTPDQGRRKEVLSAPPVPRRAEQAGNLLLFAVVGLLAGYILRLYHLDVKDIWWDEAHSWWYASLPLSEGIGTGVEAWHGAAGDPLYTVLLHIWMLFTGSSAFAMRTLSLLASLFSVAYLGRLTARAFGHHAGRLALLIGAAAPIWVFYSQEVRQYALTPLLMLIMLDAIVELSEEGGDRPVLKRATPWIKLAAGEALALYTHGFMVFGVVAVNLWMGWLWLRRLRDRSGAGLWLRNWLLSQAATLLAVLPIAPVYVQRTHATSSSFVRLNPFHTINALWSLFMGIPWEEATDPLPVRWLSAGVLVLVWLGLWIGLRRRHARRIADFMWLTLGTSALTLLYWWFTPIIHPRYLLYLTAPLFAVLAALMVESWQYGSWGRPLSAALGATLLLTSAFNLGNLYTGRYFGYRHDPARTLAEMLRENFGPEDGIISLDPNDHTLDYYGVGQAELFRAGLDEGVHTPADLVDFLRGKDRIGVVRFHAERSDTRQIVPFYLERFGSLEGKEEIESYALYTYQLDADAQPEVATFEPVTFNWGAVELTGQSLHSGGGAVTVALRWQTGPDFVPGPRYAALLTLTDPVTDWTLSTATSLLLSDGGVPTDEWQSGQQATQYLVLPLYPGTPPLEAELRLRLVDAETGRALDAQDASGAPAGQEVTPGRITLGHPPERWLYGDQVAFHLTPVDDSEVLAAYAVDWPTAQPGGVVGLTLAWIVSPEQLEEETVRLRLVQGDTVLGEESGLPLQGRTPADTPPGQSWLDRRVIPVSGEAAPGPAELWLEIGEQRRLLGSVEIPGFERLTERPPIENPLEVQFGDSIRLLGYQIEPIPAPLTSEGSLRLTLY
ncbi:MAG TPA: hypothetical protein ENI95_09905, partial [Chloroflexi bacterium]|nr:hypothetical protein [Chloroflexota bacterium]